MYEWKKQKTISSSVLEVKILNRSIKRRPEEYCVKQIRSRTAIDLEEDAPIPRGRRKAEWRSQLQ